MEHTALRLLSVGLKREFLNHHADVGVAGGFYFARDSDYNGPPTDVLGS